MTECSHTGPLDLKDTHNTWGLGRVCVHCGRPVQVVITHENEPPVLPAQEQLMTGEVTYEITEHERIPLPPPPSHDEIDVPDRRFPNGRYFFYGMAAGPIIALLLIGLIALVVSVR